MIWKEQWTEQVEKIGSTSNVVFPTFPFGELLTLFAYYFMHAKSLQACPTLCDFMDYSPPGSSVHGLSRQEYWSGLPFPSPGDLPDTEIKPGSPAPQADSLLSEPPGKSNRYILGNAASEDS